MLTFPSQEEYDTLRGSGLFLAEWYAAEYAGTLPKGADPLMDFCSRGWRAGHAPNPYFDTGFYLRENADIGQAGHNPLLHYVRQGEGEGRRPVPFFDPTWYRAAHGLDGHESSLAHFLPRRFTGHASPVPDFDPIAYLRTHPAVAEAGADPFLHAQAAANAPPLTDRQIIEISGLFDPNFYLLCNPDVREARLDPLSHFCAYGTVEKRNPNLYFDMRRHGGNRHPVVAYFVHGEIRGERPGPHFDPSWYAETYGLAPWQSALRHYLRHRRSQRFSPNADFDVEAYVAAHGASIGRNRDPFLHYLKKN